MRISVEINGVETKFTCLSSLAIVVFALLMIVATVVSFARGVHRYSGLIDGLLIM